MAQTWNECEQQARAQVQLNAVGYRFHNALMATADHWFSIVNSDESTFKQPDRYGAAVAQFFEWFRLTSKLWNDGANRTWPTQGSVEIGHVVGNSTATAAMKYFQAVVDVLNSGPIADAGLYGEHEITSDRLKAFKAALVQHFTECGIPAKPADASKILEQIELNVPAEAKAAETNFCRRWQELRERFLRTTTTKLLSAAMVQGGSIVADMVTAGRFPSDDALQSFIQVAEQERYRDRHLAEFSLNSLFQHYAMHFSDDPNIAALQIVSRQNGVTCLTGKPNSHLERAERYAAFCSEVIEWLNEPVPALATGLPSTPMQTVEKQTQATTAHDGEQQKTMLQDYAKQQLRKDSYQQNLLLFLIQEDYSVESLKCKLYGTGPEVSKKFSELWITLSKRLKRDTGIYLKKDGVNDLKLVRDIPKRTKKKIIKPESNLNPTGRRT